MSGSPRADIVEIYVRVPPEEIAFVKFIFESYEGVAVVRTADPVRAVIVLLVAADFVTLAREILAAIRSEVSWEELPAPARGS